MPGLVLELQRDCLNPKSDTSDLLRKALVVSRKLKLPGIQEWVNHELQGYAAGVEIPDYRMMNGTLKAKNPFHGWIPFVFQDPEFAEKTSMLPVNSGIKELEDVVTNRSSNGLIMTLPKQMESALMRLMSVPLPIALHISPSAVTSIFDKVRNRILEWSLELEAQGITGDNYSFTEPEKMAAQNSYNIVNNIGAMHNSQLQQVSDGSHQVQNNSIPLADLTSFADALLSRCQDLGLNQDELDELQSDVSTIKAQLASPKPKSGVIRSLLTSVKSILEGAAGNVLASTYAAQAGALLSMTPI
ncbi:hypothetical protein MI467_00190 [Delftia acidovorans]|uniref:AbiTii domain-containing protein n=1 Tax=Delftia acidovorans TaxID=80866 RepID=UPI001EFC73DE|nr:hypothetical protein [Delftia acidovorans]MCG8985256.1 hypothetical protein [Delftia acidovorans]